MTPSLKASSRSLRTHEPYEPLASPPVNRLVKALLALVVVAGLGLAGWAVFEHFEREGVAKKGERACGTLDTPKSGVTAPPGVTLPEGLKLLDVVTQGRTVLVIASQEGTRQEVVKVRDDLVTALSAAGFTKKGEDQEPGYEAEAQLGGTADASLKVRPLCQDRLEVRLTLRT